MLRHILLPLLLLSGCGHAPGSLPAPNRSPSTTIIETASGTMSITSNASPNVPEHTMNADSEAVWMALPAAFAVLDLEAGVINDAQRVYGNTNLRARGKLAGARAGESLDCGKSPIGAPTANTDLLEVMVLAAVQPVADEISTVEVRLEGLATSVAGGTKAPCTSKGKLEKRLMDQIRLQVAKQAESEQG